MGFTMLSLLGELFGGWFRLVLVFALVMKPANFVGEVFVLRKIQIQRKEGWLGW